MRVSGQAAVHGSMASAKAGTQTISDADTGFAALLAAALPEETNASLSSTLVPADLPASEIKDEDFGKGHASSAGDTGGTAIPDSSLLALLPDPLSMTPPILQARTNANAPLTAEPGAAQPAITSIQPALPTGIDAFTGAVPNELPKHHAPGNIALPEPSPMSATPREPAELPVIARAEVANVDHASGIGLPNVVHHQALPAEPIASANSSATALHVPVPVYTDHWGQALGEQVLWMAQKDVQSASLTLNPPELGPVRIELQLTDGQAIASFSSAQPEVRKAIEDALPSLKTMFADAGLNLQQADVGSGHAQSREPQQFQQPRNGDTGAGRDTSVAGLAGVSVPLSTRTSVGMLDTYA